MLIWGGWDETAGVVKVPPEQGPPFVMDGGSVSPFPPGDPAQSGARYDLVTDAWSAMSASGQPSIRAGHVAIWTGTEMIVWGGAVPPFVSSRGNVLSDGGAYNPDTNTWRAIEPAPNTGLAGATAAWTGTEMLVWGGYDDTSYSNRGYRYNPTSDTWQYITTVGAPEPRVGAGGVWTGKAFALFGGTDGLPFDDGALWYPDLSDASP
jgi:N-acetylneuraminic acid mutarotase